MIQLKKKDIIRDESWSWRKWRKDWPTIWLITNIDIRWYVMVQQNQGVNIINK